MIATDNTSQSTPTGNARLFSAAALAFLLLLCLLATGYWKYKHRARVDEFGHPISLEPGGSRVTPAASARVEDAAERARLPEFQDVAAASPSELTPGTAFMDQRGQWTRSQGDEYSSRYSSLTTINRTNVAHLQIAWTYHSKDGTANVQCTPVIVDGVLYAPTAGNAMVALDAASGREIWRFRPGGHPAQRGLLYWPGQGGSAARLFFTSGASLFALDAASGQPVRAFGHGGKVPSGGTVSPVVAQGVLVAANFNVVSGYDVNSGRSLWSFSVLRNPKDDRVAADAASDSNDRGANVWGGMAADSRRGIIYVATGAPHPNFIGLDHLGDNEHSDSVLALEARTGRLLWSFQEVRHDIWDLDVPAPPNLVTVLHEGKRVDAVAQVTKLGNTLLLDRVSGKPLFPYRLRRAPVSTLPGERTSPYQPAFQLPQPFTRQEWRLSDVTDLSPQAQSFVLNQVAGANHGWFQPFEPGKPTVYYNVNGGAEWTGAGFDPGTGLLYVNANEIPWIMTVLKARLHASTPAGAPSPGEQLFVQNCSGCHGLNRKGKGMAPSLLGLANRMLDDEAVGIIQHGRNAMPPISVSAQQRQSIINYLFDRDLPPESAEQSNETPYTYFSNGYPKLMDDSGYPGTKPPWGTLNAIDLNTGKLAWKVPLGEYDELTKRGVPKTGTENFGGATVTAGGLVFCAGTRDLKIRAFDKESGAELWAAKLPYGGFAPPATYQVRGQQFVVIAATGGGKLGGPKGDAYVAFALPRPGSIPETKSPISHQE